MKTTRLAAGCPRVLGRVCAASLRQFGRATVLGTALIVGAATFGGTHPLAANAAAQPTTTCAVGISTGGSCTSGPVVLTPAQKDILAKKQVLAQELAQVQAGKVSLATYRKDAQDFLNQYGGARKLPTTSPLNGMQPNAVVPYAYPSSGDLYGLNQQSQATTYYCGPAAASEMVTYLGHGMSQQTLAGSNYLQTDSIGNTPWNPAVMGPTLNKVIGSSFYVAVNGSGVNGGFSTSTYASDLESDISQGYPVAGNVVEQPGGPYLTGHDSSQTIYHWIALYGYDNNGYLTSYADSVGGTSFWWWSSRTPRYTTGYDSNSMTTLLNQRGYVW